MSIKNPTAVSIRHRPREDNPEGRSCLAWKGFEEELSERVEM